jgi:hypothetical protein
MVDMTSSSALDLQILFTARCATLLVGFATCPSLTLGRMFSAVGL